MVLWGGALWKDQAFREKLKFFRGVFLFQGLRPRDLSELVPHVMEKAYAVGDVIFNEGEAGRACFIVAEGRVSLTQKERGKTSGRLLMEAGPGDFFGEMVLLDELPRTATAKVEEPSRLYILYKSQFDLLLQESPRVSAVVLHTLARLLSARLRQKEKARSAD